MEQTLFDEYPNATSKLVGGKIMVRNNNGADWVRVGKQYVIKKAKDGKILIDKRWWQCRQNECRQLFQLVEKPPKPVYLVGPVNQMLNGLLGIKVERGPDWIYDDQDEAAAYGEIINYVNDYHVQVMWYDKDRYKLRANHYRVNYKGKNDLMFHTKYKQKLNNERDPVGYDDRPFEPARFVPRDYTQAPKAKKLAAPRGFEIVDGQIRAIPHPVALPPEPNLDPGNRVFEEMWDGPEDDIPALAPQPIEPVQVPDDINAMRRNLDEQLLTMLRPRRGGLDAARNNEAQR